MRRKNHFLPNSRICQKGIPLIPKWDTLSRTEPRLHRQGGCARCDGLLQNSQTVSARGWFFVGIGSRFFGAFVVYYWKYKHRRNAMTGICQSGYKKITQHSRCFHFDFHPAAQSVFRISVFSVPSVFWQAVFCCPFVDLFTILWYNGEYRIFMHVSRDFLYS